MLAIHANPVHDVPPIEFADPLQTGGAHQGLGRGLAQFLQNAVPFLHKTLPRRCGFRIWMQTEVHQYVSDVIHARKQAEVANRHVPVKRVIVRFIDASARRHALCAATTRRAGATSGGLIGEDQFSMSRFEARGTPDGRSH